jgi:hypothetical protein
MQEIDEKMKATDWFDRNYEYLPTTNVSLIRPDQNLSGLEWKAAMQSKRQDIIDKKTKSLPSHSNIHKSSLKNANY